MRDTDNQPNESDTIRRAGSLAEPHRGTVLDVSHDDIAHDRHDEGAERRQELDLPPPLDARGNLAERVRATFTAEADAADARGRAAGVDGEESTPILAALAQLRTKQSERARGPAPRLRPKTRRGTSGANLLGALSSVAAGYKRGESPPRRRAQGRGGPAPRF